MPTFTPMLADRRGRGVIASWRADLGFGFIRDHNGETTRFDFVAAQAGQWPQVGEEVVFGYEVCPKTGDPIATGLRLTGPRRSPPPEPVRRGFFA
jgi:hypothetical protein